MSEAMAHLEAFPGLRYDLGQVGTLSDVVAPPYDVIDPALQEQLYSRHPHNIIRLELTQAVPGEPDQAKYQRAGRLWRDWQLDGILRTDPHPALYVLHQEFAVEGRKYVRKGVFARVRLERFGEGTIYPHEQTLSGPKEDRFRLMMTTQANLSPIFGLYPDEGRAIQSTVDAAVERSLPTEATDHLGVVNRVWPIYSPAVIRPVIEQFGDKPIFIADGHHRYETALRYRDDLAAAGKLTPDHPANFVLMALVSMRDPGLIILPTHRLVQGYPGVTATQLRDKLAPTFNVEVIGQGKEAARKVWDQLDLEDSQDLLGFGTTTDDTWLLARLDDPDVMEQLVPQPSDDWRALAVSRLHVLVLGKLLVTSGNPSVRYVHLLDEVLANVKERGCDLACLVPPVSIQHVTAIAGRLEKMPPKSTYFYPKLLTGLVFHSLR
jgi:uncharacterized protein (DUF1015 family)